MIRIVTVGPQAAASLTQARLYLRQPGSGRIGQSRWEALLEIQLRLLTHPYLGARSPDQPGRRQIVVSGYRVIYSIDSDTGDSDTAGDVRIVAVLGPGQA